MLQRFLDAQASPSSSGSHAYLAKVEIYF